ncbi:MAG: LD-carboxypeptidase [Clostridium butyricum]|nr:LD-carboxypeptidase [Clostridium butyricum]
MIKPKILKKGDKIAIVSLSWGGLGDKELIHKYYIAKDRLENDFGLEVVAMPNALKGSEFVYEHPEARAQDLMDAFKDESIKGIFCAIGGDDSIRLLPYIDYEVIRNNPKVFMGYSDTTVNHLMLNKAGLVSFYGPSIMCEFGEYVKMFDYTKQAVENILFTDCKNYEIRPSEVWSNDFVFWKEENINKAKKLIPEEHGYETLQGGGIITGQLLGGCIDVFPMVIGTEIWPAKEEWKDKILLLETSEEKPSPDLVTYYLRNLGAQGIFNVIKGIIVGKPQAEKYYDEYKEVYKKVMKEFNCENLPILYNINIGHAYPTGILPLGTDVQVDFDNKKILLIETPTKN